MNGAYITPVAGFHTMVYLQSHFAYEYSLSVGPEEVLTVDYTLSIAYEKIQLPPTKVIQWLCRWVDVSEYKRIEENFVDQCESFVAKQHQKPKG